MPHYIVLANWTEQGVKNVRESPKRFEAFRKSVEAAGGKLKFAYYTMGPHDFVAGAEFPSDEKANEVILKNATAGNVHTLTLKAWTPEEFAALVGKL